MRKSLLLLMCMVLSLATWGQDSTDGITVSDDGTTVTVDLSKARLSSVTNTEKVTSLTLTSDNVNTGVTFEDAKYLHDNFVNLKTLDMRKTTFMGGSGSEDFSVNVVDHLDKDKNEATTTYKGQLKALFRGVPDGFCAGKTSLVTVYLPANSYVKNGDKNVQISRNSGSVGKYSFAGCTSLETIDLGGNGNFSFIDNGAFIGCVSLKSIDMSGFNNKVWSKIGDDAFRYCKALSSVNFPNVDNVDTSKKQIFLTIGARAFQGCTSLTTVTLPNSVSEIKNDAFNGCSELTSISIPNSVTAIGRYCFNECTKLAKVNLPTNEKFTTINANLFTNCKALASIDIPNNVTTILNHVFNGCDALTSIVIPNSVDSIGNNCFYVCNNLTSITLPTNDKFKTISQFAFGREPNLTSITIPSSVTTIGRGAFQGDNKLTITVTSATPPVGNESDANNAFWTFGGIHYNSMPAIIFEGDAVGHEKDYRNTEGWKYIMSKSIDETDTRVGYQNWGDILAPANHVRLYLQRTFADGWNTLVLPFSATGDVVKAAFGDNVKIAEFTGAEGNTLHFTTVDDCAIEEGKPYIISDVTVPTTDTKILYKGSYVDKPNAYVFDDVNITNSYGTNDNVNDSYIKAATFDGVTMTGTFRQKSLSLKNGYFIQNGNLFPVVSGTVYKTRGFRAWFETTSSNAKPLTFSVDGGAATGISKIDADKADNSKIYDLQGREVSKPVKGIYIKNGRKFIVK